MTSDSNSPLKDSYLYPAEVEKRFPFLRAQTLATWRLKGIGPAYVRLGKRIIYPLSAIQRWIDHNTVEPCNDGKAHRKDKPR